MDIYISKLKHGLRVKKCAISVKESIARVGYKSKTMYGEGVILWEFATC